MKSFFKLDNAIFIILIMVNGCQILPPNQSNDIVISDHEKVLIKKFAMENGYPEKMPLDSFVRYVYRAWPNESVRKDFFLTFPKQDTIPRTLVLSNTLSSINKSLRVYYEPAPYGGAISSAIIDSIEIITDSVIVFPGLNLSYCNLTNIPPEIGKIRVHGLDIGSNKIKTLPLEIMSIFNHLPVDSGIIRIAGNPLSQDYWDSIPDTLKNWIIRHTIY